MPHDSSQNRPLCSRRPTSLSLSWISSLYLSSCLGGACEFSIDGARGTRISRHLWSMMWDDAWMMSSHALQPPNCKSCCHGDPFLFFFFPAVKCGQGLKQWNERVNLHKSKERHSGVLECLCLYISVCVLVCLCAEMHVGFRDPSLLPSLPCLLVDGSTSSCVMSGLCYAESWPTQSVDWK